MKFLRATRQFSNRRADLACRPMSASLQKRPFLLRGREYREVPITEVVPVRIDLPDSAFHEIRAAISFGDAAYRDH